MHEGKRSEYQVLLANQNTRKNKTFQVLFLQGKTKISDATVTIITRTTNFQVRQPVRKQPFYRLKVNVLRLLATISGGIAQMS